MNLQLKMHEGHHAHILMAFYRSLREYCGPETGTAVFMTAARAYGERRGRRMAMRALRDGKLLNVASYFAYGELLPTEGAYEGTYTAETGVVHEQQVRCPWADAFRQAGGLDCAIDYCREIDRSIVCGFNPTLTFACTQNMHTCPSCDFFFYSPEIQGDFMQSYRTGLQEGQAVKRDMTYHCADVFQMFSYVVGQTLPESGVLEKVRLCLEDRFGQAFFDQLLRYAETDFNQI